MQGLEPSYGTLAPRAAALARGEGAAWDDSAGPASIVSLSRMLRNPARADVVRQGAGWSKSRNRLSGIPPLAGFLFGGGGRTVVTIRKVDCYCTTVR